MEFDHTFSVAAPIDAVWAMIADIQRVAPCVPNTRVTARAGPDSHNVEITAAVGPFEITSEGTITLTERDDAAHREVLKVIANDADGDQLAEAMLTIVLTEAAGTTDAAVHSSVELGGIGLFVSEEALDHVAGDMLRTFASNLEGLLREAPEPA
ncbi:MAG TPA: SRPBCC domain-containing protein [Solirubrobacteraceae bacterium]|nr:SRPBCC domain-containing protein [Solirubrobacteraceae bacterium]